MKIPFHRYIIMAVLMLLPALSHAQFFVTGDDPEKAQWYSIETDHFKVIYPEGADSLAKEYAYKIEKYRIPVSLTTGYASGDGDGKKMPVVMHAYNAANGSVAWAPKRMDLFTIPSAYDPEPLPWSTMLSVHESRHVTQMQFGMTKAQKPFGWIFGEMWNILASLVYPGICKMEGDAVITETAWTPSGRGRTADFLNYYWVAFDNGDFGNWNRWRFMSQKNYAPDHYALGYLYVGGMRYLYDCPDLMSQGYHLAALRPYNLISFPSTEKKISGLKKKDSFKNICDTLYTLWSADAEARRPYIASEPVSPEPRIYTDYIDNFVVGTAVYSIKKGHLNAPEMVRLDSTGREHRISLFALNAGRPKWSEDQERILWSETKADARWNLQTRSIVRSMSKDGKEKRNLDGSGLIYNPSPDPSGNMTATVSYSIGGRSALDIMDAEGTKIRSFDAPDSLQLVETAWIGDDIYATAVSDNGYGIYGLDRNSGIWKTVLAPQPVMMKDFGAREDILMFTCDRTGVNELYHLDPSSSDLRQKTSTRYGASDFSYSEDGQWLYYSSQTLKGMRIFRTHADSLLNKEADFSILHKYPIAEKVTAQEKALAAELGVQEITDIEISEPKRYRKFPHMFNVHSWTPVYVNVDNIMNMSFGQIWEAASLGASGIIQNRLSTATGEFGYSAHKDPYNNAVWRHSGHARFKYSGLYPVLEASVDVNDRAARQYYIYSYNMTEGRAMEITSRETGAPYVEGRFSAYIPFRFSSGGWYKGVTPRISYRIGNDMFRTGVSELDLENHVGLGSDGKLTEFQRPVFVGAVSGKNTFRHSISSSLSAYIIQSTPNSAVYPRWGAGMEVGATGNIDSRQFISPTGYAYMYGYLPGIIREQGIKLSAMSQVKLNGNAVFGQAAVNILPRGLSQNASLTSWLSVRTPVITRLTVDYAVPIFIGDVSIGGTFFSIKRLVITPHFDYTFFSGTDLWSAGTDLCLDLHSILTLTWPCSLGVTISYNGGSAFNNLSETSGITMKRWYVGPQFNVTF